MKKHHDNEDKCADDADDVIKDKMCANNATNDDNDDNAYDVYHKNQDSFNNDNAANNNRAAKMEDKDWKARRITTTPIRSSPREPHGRRRFQSRNTPPART